MDDWEEIEKKRVQAISSIGKSLRNCYPLGIEAEKLDDRTRKIARFIARWLDGRSGYVFDAVAYKLLRGDNLDELITFCGYIAWKKLWIEEYAFACKMTKGKIPAKIEYSVLVDQEVENYFVKSVSHAIKPKKIIKEA